MRTAFDTLLKVNFNHSYFSDGSFKGFAITVSAATRQLFQNLGLLFKPVSDGFYILYDQNSGGSTRTREDVMKENTRMEFFLNLNDPNFYGYTANMPGEIANSVFYFHNAANTGPAARLLHVNEFVSENDVYNFKYFNQPFFNKPFAKLDLAINPQTEDQYYIKFQARATYWRYILVSDYLQGLKNPAILGSDDSDIFEKPSQLKLPDERVVNAFVSSVKLNFCQYASKTFKLVETDDQSTDGRVVIGALPVADARLVSRIGNNPDPNNSTKPINYSDYSDILIH